MAKQIITTITDDLDGSEADETLTFAVDGIAYEIDLSSKNAGEFREFMSRFQDAGTRVGRVGAGAQLTSHRRQIGGGVSAATNRAQNQEIRAWALKNGYDELSERGRIPQHIQDAFHSGTPAPGKVTENTAAAERLAAEVEAEKPAVRKRTPAKKAAPAHA